MNAKMYVSVGLLMLVGLMVYLLLPFEAEKQQSLNKVKVELTEPATKVTVLATKSEETLITPTKTTENLTLVPDPISEVDTEEYAQTTDDLWQLAEAQNRPETVDDNIYVEYIQMVANGPMNVSEGEKMSFLIPQENKSYVGTVNELTSDYDGEVKLSSGDIETDNAFSSFSIAQGEITTFITVATGESIYQIEIDNKSGVGTVIDDRELDQYRFNEDGITPPPDGVEW